MNATVSIYRTPAGERAVMAQYDAALNAWSVPYQTRKIATRAGETFVVVCGAESAPALILLHGAGTNSSIWAHDAAAYSQDYRVYAVDLPGEPGKSAAVYPSWEGTALAEWLGDVLDGLKVKRATLAGISQGAFTALKFAVAQPERVERLVLITPGGIVRDRSSFIMKAIVWSLFGQRGQRHLLRRIFGSQPVPESVLDILLAMQRHFKPRLGILPLFTDAELARLTMPVLLLGGTDDIMRDIPAIGERLRAFVPHLAMKLIPGGGHALVNTTGDVMMFLKSDGLAHVAA